VSRFKSSAIKNGRTFKTRHYANTFGFKRGDFPNAEFVSDRTISLPLSAKLTEEDSNDVIRAVKKIIEKH